MSKFARRLWKWTAAALAGVLILLGVGVGLFRAAVPLVPEWRAEAEAMAERALGWPVRIGAMDLRWAVFGPELVLTDVQLLAPDTWQPLISAAELDIVFGPLGVFQDGPVRPSHVRLHQPTLALERGADGVLYLSGYALPSGGGSRVDWRRMLELGLKHGRLTIIDGDLHYRDVAREIPDWTLHVRELTFASDGEHHEFDGIVLPPGVLGEQISLRFTAEGPPATPETWHWNLDLEARELHLAEWYRQFGWARTGTARGLLGLTASLEGRGLETVTGKGTLRASALGFADFSPMVGPVTGTPESFEQVGFAWAAQFGEKRLDIDVTELVIERNTERFRDGAISLRTGGQEYPLEIAAFRLPLAELAGLARFLPVTNEEGALARIRDAALHLAPTGELQELILGIDTRSEPARFHVQGAFRDLGARPYGELPGFDGLSGTLRGTEAAGEVRLDSRDVTLDFGDLFRSPRPVQALAARLAWETTEAGWRITGTDITVKNPEASATAAMTLEIPSDGPVRIDLAARATDINLEARSAWLPVGIMSEPLVHWLDTAILAGRVPEAAFTLRGPLGNFPFRDGSGVFDIRFTVEDAAIEYAPGWPAVEDLRADVHFNGPALDIRVAQATTMESLAITEGQARFPDLRDGLLEISAQANGNVATGWRFLRESPLREPLDGLLNALNVHGPMQADISLNIPLRDVDETAVRVIAGLHGVDVKPVALPWTVEGVRGLVTVTEHDASAERLTGSLTGAPFAASITLGEAAPGGFAATEIAMQGHSPVTVFEEFLPPEWLARLDGEFDWTGNLSIPGGGESMAFHVTSPLAGVQSRLPAPLDVIRPTSATILLPGEGRIETTVEVPDLGASRLLFTETPDGWRFERGRWLLGAEAPPELPAQAGLHVEGATAVLDARGWLDLDNPPEPDERPAPGEAATRDAESILRSFDLDAGRLLAGNLVLEGQSLRGNRLGAGWELSLDGPATGSIRIPSLEDTGLPWDVRLERLHLPGEEPGEETDGTTEEPPHDAPDPRDAASLTLDIRDFRIGAMQFGRVTGTLQRTVIGYTTQGLRADAPSFNITLDGRWEVINDEHYTSVSTVLESRDLGETLAKLGYASGGIDADDGRIEANLAWHAAPTAIDYGLLEGTVKFSARDGSLREVSPGAGRLIGLLSIAALPRRLMLDFSDFFGQGLYFDTLSGDFLLTDGNAYTTNARLEGPSISALLVGRTGLVARDYDQLAIVDTDVSASIPVAGYLAAGPTVGAALLLLSQLLKAPLADITQVKYRITGSWDEPVVERVQQANAQKTPPQNR